LSDAERAGAGTRLLPEDQMQAITALDESGLMRRLLGDPVVDMVTAVRRMEHDRYTDLEPAALADKFRMAWSL
jgi:glutamine synthetase